MDGDVIASLQRRVAALEARRDSRAFDEHALKSQAAQQRAQEPAQSYVRMQQQSVNLGGGSAQETPYAPYAPLRSDTKPLIDLAAFARRLLNPDDLGHAVTKEVRDSARRALGMPEVREYDL